MKIALFASNMEIVAGSSGYAAIRRGAKRLFQKQVWDRTLKQAGIDANFQESEGWRVKVARWDGW